MPKRPTKVRGGGGKLPKKSATPPQLPAQTEPVRPRRRLDRSTTETWGAIILGLIAAAIPMTWWFEAALLLVIAVLILDIALHAPWSQHLTRWKQVGTFAAGVAVLGLLGVPSMTARYREAHPKVQVTAPIDAPMDLLAVVTVGNYRRGSVINGNVWRNEYTELHFSLVNHTNYDLKNFSFLVVPDVPVAFMAQITDVPGVFFQRTPDPIQSMYGIDHNTGFPYPLNTEVVANDTGYRVGGQVLPSHSSIDIIIAAVLINPRSEIFPKPDGKIVHLKNYLAKYGISGGHFWVGFQGDRNVFEIGANPKVILVDGKYEVENQALKIKKTVMVTALQVPNITPKPFGVAR